jgi:hypothetical protein
MNFHHYEFRHEKKALLRSIKSGRAARGPPLGPEPGGPTRHGKGQRARPPVMELNLPGWMFAPCGGRSRLTTGAWNGRSKLVVRSSLFSLLLALSGCARQSSGETLRIRMESLGRLVEGPLGALRLDLEEGCEFLVTARLLDSKHVFVGGTLRRDTGVLDQPEFVVAVGGEAGYRAPLGSVHALASGSSGVCPLRSAFARFEPPLATHVRISVQKSE